MALVKGFNGSSEDNSLIMLREAIRAKIGQKVNYPKLEKEYRVNRYYLWKIANDESYQPPFKVCEILGIQAFLPAPVCPIHGVVHDGVCPDSEFMIVRKRKIRPPRRLDQLSQASLRTLLSDRVEWDGQVSPESLEVVRWANGL